MSIAKAVSILIALEAEIVAEAILKANEGFDGEIETTDLALRVVKHLAAHKWSRRGISEIREIVRTGAAPAPITRAEATGGAATNPHYAARKARSRRQPKTCNRCGQEHLHWESIEGRWALCEEDGSRHSCPRPGQTAGGVGVHSEEKSESFSTALKKV